MDNVDKRTRDANRDPITGAPGSHPIGTGLGAAAGGMAAGAAAGTVAGPVGTVIGAAAGAVIGGLAGKAAGEAFDPTGEEAYWAENYANEPYYRKDYTFDDYAPAYRAGYMGRNRFADKNFADVERDLEADYRQNKGSSKMDWPEARQASLAAWERGARSRH